MSSARHPLAALTLAAAALAALLLTAPEASAQGLLSTAELGRRGPEQVQTTDRRWTDRARRRAVPVRIYAPRVRPGVKRPLLVFSHGLGGSHEGYAFFGEHLASDGFVVIHPTHKGSDAAVARRGGLKALIRAGADPKNRSARPKDVSFVIDQVRRLRSREPLLRQVDMKRIGVAGHSFGAYTALAVVGQTIRAGRRTLRFTDPRVRCALAMSPQAPGTLGLTAQSWSRIRVPVFTLTGTLDTGLGTPKVEDRRVAFESMPRGQKFHLTIKDAEHSAFADSAWASRDPRHHGWILAAATGFFRAQLQGSRPAQRWLKSSRLQRDTLGEVKQERR